MKSRHMKSLPALLIATVLCLSPSASFAKSKKDNAAKMESHQIVALADISVGLSGLVCDFCSLALNKTFKKRDEVRATYVDLDTKTLSVVLNSGQSLPNETLMTLVKKAGYSTTKITRKDGSEFIPAPKS